MSVTFAPTTTTYYFPKDRSGLYTFHEACRGGFRNNVIFALKKGQDPTALDEHGRSGLSYACERKKKGVCITLLAAGASLNHPDTDGYTPLYYACNSRVFTIPEMKALGADFSIKCPNGTSLLKYVLTAMHEKALSDLNIFRENLEN